MWRVNNCELSKIDEKHWFKIPSEPPSTKKKQKKGKGKKEKEKKKNSTLKDFAEV